MPDLIKERRMVPMRATVHGAGDLRGVRAAICGSDLHTYRAVTDREAPIFLITP
jgi:threonine dehydrogenase-like Zn-dependent dehydrogenase